MGFAALIAAGVEPEDLPQPARSPVARRHLDRARASLRSSIEQLERLEVYLALCPDDAAGFGAISDRAGDLLEQTRVNVVRFWNITDCSGEG